MEKVVNQPLSIRSILTSLPDEMQKILRNQAFKTDTVGCSGAHIFLFDHDLVLKVEFKSAESDTEFQMIRWLQDKLPVPKIKAFHTDGSYNYLLMTKLPGKMACDEQFMRDGTKMVRLLAQGLKLFWQTSIDGCPRFMGLDQKLDRALWRLEQQQIQVKPETLQANGFSSLRDQFQYLCEQRPEETSVLVHGDYCLVNVLIANDDITGFIDFGRCGIGDQWQDITMCVRSLHYNLSLSNQEKTYHSLYRIFFDELGIEPDEQKMKYYHLLNQFL